VSAGRDSHGHLRPELVGGWLLRGSLCRVDVNCLWRPKTKHPTHTVPYTWKKVNSFPAGDVLVTTQRAALLPMAYGGTDVALEAVLLAVAPRMVVACSVGGIVFPHAACVWCGILAPPLLALVCALSWTRQACHTCGNIKLCFSEPNLQDG
jgi:hypothetical protein